MGRRPDGSYTGEGVRQLKSGVWELRFSIGPDPIKRRDGRPVYRYKSVTYRGTKAEAKAERQRLMDMARPSAEKATDRTFRELFGLWIDSAEADLSPSTIQAHKALASKHILPAFGDTKLRDLKTFEIERFYGHLHAPKPDGAGLHPRSIRRVHAVINTALKRAVAWEWLPRNPAEVAKPPRIHGRPTLYTPTIDELRSALAVALADSPSALALIWTAAATGMRRGELCGLQWGDLRPEAGVVMLERNVVEVNGRAIIKTPKSGKGRIVALSPEVLKVLGAYRTMLQEAADTAGVKLGPWIWSKDYGAHHIFPAVLTETWNRVKTAAGIPDECRLHDLRHAYGTILMADMDGKQLGSLADQLGHSDKTTTARFYLQGLSTGQRELADRMGQLLALPVSDRLSTCPAP